MYERSVSSIGVTDTNSSIDSKDNIGLESRATELDSEEDQTHKAVGTSNTEQHN